MKIFAIIVIVVSAISTSEVVKNYPRLSQLPDLALPLNGDLPPLSLIISKTPPSKQYLNENDHQVTDKRDASAEAFHEPLSPLGPYPPVPRYPRCQHVLLLRAHAVF